MQLGDLQDILTESFDPIVELTTGADLMMAMVYAQELGDWDYSGMYTAVLKFKVWAPVSAGALACLARCILLMPADSARELYSMDDSGMYAASSAAT